MGTVHKFKRPPKNQQQFRGHRPDLSKNPGGRKLRDWQRSVIAWLALVLFAAGLWAIGAMIG